MAVNDHPLAKDGQTRPWKRLWAAYALFFLLATPILGAATILEVGARLGSTLNAPGLWLTEQIRRAFEMFDINTPFSPSELGAGLPRALLLAAVLAPIWFLLARRTKWANGIPNFWSAALASVVLCLGTAALQLAPTLIGHSEPHAARLWWWAIAHVVLLLAGLFIGAPLLFVIGGSRVRRAEVKRTFGNTMPWWRKLAAYVLVLAIPGVVFWAPSALNPSIVNEFGATPMLSMGVAMSLALALVLAPLWWIITRHRIWKHGAPDFWGCVIAAALLYAAIEMLQLIYIAASFDGDQLFDHFTAWLTVALGVLTVGSLVGGGLVYLMLGRRSATVPSSMPVEISALPQHPIPERTVRTNDLATPIRVRERLDVINALLSSWFLLFPFLMLVVMMVVLVVYALSLIGVTENYFGSSSGLSFIYIVGLSIAALAFAIPLSLLSRIHRRALASFGAIFCFGIVAYAAWRVLRFAEAATLEDTRNVKDELLLSLTMAALPTWIVFGSMLVAFAGLALASRDDFMIGRGWRPPLKSWVSSAQRFLGMPTYVSSLGQSRWIATSLFVSAIVLSAAWVAMPFLSAFPLGVTNVSILGSAESQIAQSRSICHDSGGEHAQAYLSRDATYLADTPLDACVHHAFSVLGGRFGSLTAISLMIALAGVFALIGLPLGRAAQRAATRAYQNVRDWDDRPPVVFLRAFRADEAHVPARPHGLLPRLAIRPGSPRTLDEIVLDLASPLGPVIAVGRPDEDLPPLGAARIYAAGQDWREIVTQLCDSAAAIIICLDASEGVSWEFAEITRRGHEHKTIWLTSPQLSRAERAHLVQHLFGVTHTSEIIGGYSQGEELGVMSAPRVSRAAYKTAITRGLSAISETYRLA